jgi:NADPH:quinone reductase-like Zn-dependent oxidoreductase
MRQIKLDGTGWFSSLNATDLSPSPAPKSDEIKVAVRASSLNYHDLLVCKSASPSRAGLIPLSDAAAEVLEVGAGVTEFVPGDHIVSCYYPRWLSRRTTPFNNSAVPGDGYDGFARSELTLPAASVTRAPAGWSHAEAATITTAGLTAWRALVVDGPLRAGETVVTLGTGGVSIFAMQIAKAMGARVIVTSSSDEKLARARELGADEAINYRSTPDWGMVVRDLTGGDGADHIIETGGPGSIAQSVVAARPGGHIAVIGILAGLKGDVPLTSVLMRQLRVQGLMVGTPEDQKDFVPALEIMGIRPVIDKVFDLSDLGAAFEYQEAGRHFGKISVSI